VEETLMEEKEVSAEEMTEQETSDFEEAFAGEEAGEEEAKEEETGEEATEGEEAESEAGEEEPPETEEAGNKEEEKKEAPPSKIMVNGREYTQEEIMQKLSEPPKRYGVLEQMAKDAGKSVDDYLADVEEKYAAARVESRKAQLVGQGMEESLAQHVAETEMENARLKAGTELAQQAEAKRKETQSQTEARMKAEIEEFNSVYPDVREIPPEVLDEISKTGHSPVVAYQNYLLHKQEAELKALKQSKKNKESTPGSVKGTKAGEKDEFSEAFMAAMKD
jgi:hypothetical protein